MSYSVFFDFSTGLERPVLVPAGTTKAIMEHVERVEATLGLKRTQSGQDDQRAIYWDHFDPEYRQGFPSVVDDILCTTIQTHNDWVRMLFASLSEWATNPIVGGETMTPEDAKLFWHGLQLLTVNPDRWTRKYYVHRMEHLYEVMRGREHEGVLFDAKKLSEKQAAAVIRVFAEYLDAFDMRLDVPRERDYLASSYDGGYDWCEGCGAITPDDASACRKRKCPLAIQQ